MAHDHRLDGTTTGDLMIGETRLARSLFVTAGLLFVGIGVVGVVVPILPTTPFLLLATACFARGSRRLHHWLLHNRVFGETLRRYRNGEGLALGAKASALILLFCTLGASAFLAVPPRLYPIRLLLLGVGLGVTIHILRIRTRTPQPRQTREVASVSTRLPPVHRNPTPHRPAQGSSAGVEKECSRAQIREYL